MHRSGLEPQIMHSLTPISKMVVSNLTQCGLAWQRRRLREYVFRTHGREGNDFMVVTRSWSCDKEVGHKVFTRIVPNATKDLLLDKSIR